MEGGSDADTHTALIPVSERHAALQYIHSRNLGPFLSVTANMFCKMYSNHIPARELLKMDFGEPLQISASSTRNNKNVWQKRTP